MAKRAPSRRPAASTDDDAERGMTNFSDAGGEEEDEEEDDDSEEEDEDGDTDRGDDHDPTDDDEEDDEEEDEDGDEEDDLDGEDGDEEDEDEEGEEDEEEEDADADALDDIANPGGRIPLARLNQVLEQNRALTEMVLQLTGQGGKGATKDGDAAPAFDLKAKIKERNALLLEGKEDEASTIDLEIEEHRTRTAQTQAFQTVQAGLQQQATNAAIAQVQKDYPVLNDKSRKFDQDTLDEVVALRNVYIARGEPMASAIAKAAKRICGRTSLSRDRDGERGERRGKKRDGERRNPEELTPRERRVQMMRARRQPGALHKAGASSRQMGAPGGGSGDNLSEREVRQMSDREKREARGDFDVNRGKRSSSGRRR